MRVTVQPGDSLSAILKRHNVPGWNTAAVWNQLASQLRSKNPSLIYPGEVIDLSPVLPQATTQPTTTTQTTQPTTSSGTQSGTQAGTEAKREDWDKILPWQQYFDENLVRSSEAARAAAYFDPLVQRGRENMESDFAGRGLTRSSMRGKSVMEMYDDFARQEQSMREQTYGIREREADVNRGKLQEKYEADPRGFKPSTYKYEPYEYQHPEESPYKYSQSYRDWMRSAFKL